MSFNVASTATAVLPQVAKMRIVRKEFFDRAFGRLYKMGISLQPLFRLIRRKLPSYKGGFTDISCWGIVTRPL